MSDIKATLGTVHEMTADDMLRRLEQAKKDGVSISAAEWRAITDFLKYNNIELKEPNKKAAEGEEKPPLQKVAERLPFTAVAQEMQVSA